MTNSQRRIDQRNITDGGPLARDRALARIRYCYFRSIISFRFAPPGFAVGSVTRPTRRLEHRGLAISRGRAGGMLEKHREARGVSREEYSASTNRMLSGWSKRRL